MTGNRGSGRDDRIVVSVDPDLEELIPTFLSNRNKDIVAIRQALAAKDYESIRTIGHSMKGSGGGYGFDRITEIGRTIEFAAKDSKAGEIEKAVKDLEDYLERVEVVLE